jgi:hypothetical protein
MEFQELGQEMIRGDFNHFRVVGLPQAIQNEWHFIHLHDPIEGNLRIDDVDEHFVVEGDFE